MKKLALLSIAFLMHLVANAQFERVVPENGYERFLRTMKGDYSIVYSSGDAEVFDFKAQPIMNLDYTEPVGGYWNAFELIDTSVVFTGGGFWLDQFGWLGIPMHRHFDVNWGEIAHLGNLSEDIPNAEMRINGGFISYDQSYPGLKCRKGDGMIIWEDWDNNRNIFDVATNMNLQTMAATSQGLQVIDSIGQNDSIYADYTFKLIETISFGNMVAAKPDTIYLLNSDFEIINKAPIPGETVKDMKSMEGRVAVLTESNHVYLYDQDLMPISDFQLDYPHLTFKNIVPDEDGVVLAGDHHYGVFPNGNNAVFVKKFGADGFDPFERRDIGLYFVQPATKTDVWPENGKYKVRFYNVTFQVFNYSDTILTSFRANVRFPDLPMEWPLQPNPIHQHFFKQFNNLNLAPGQSTSLTWDEFTATFVDYPSGNNLELCFWSSMPDGKSDVNPNNDVACADFFVNDKESNPDKIGFEVFPNPTTSSCSVTYSLPTTSESELYVYDEMGRLLRHEQLVDGKNRFIINELTKGMNLFVLKVNGTVVKTEKLIRE